MEPTNSNIKFAKLLRPTFQKEQELVNPENGVSEVPQILFITTFPPRECGIATYSQDLIKTLNRQFVNSFETTICAIENDNDHHQYSDAAVRFKLNTSSADSFTILANEINSADNIAAVVIQHEFGFFAENLAAFNLMVASINKPLIFAFHTVLPSPDAVFTQNVEFLLSHANGVIVMTNRASEILSRDYNCPSGTEITVISHGTHLVPHLDKEYLKAKYGFEERKVLSTFGLLSSGKSIETTIDALPAIVKTSPEVIFLIIGKTHPNIVLNEGEKYRLMLQHKIDELGLNSHVRFVNKYLPLDELLEYLQMTDIYLFTSKDPNQAVSGTFSYALSSGCPVISTPIPHAKEVLGDDAGLMFDFGNSSQLADCVNRLLFDVRLRNNIIRNGLHKITGTAWENAAVAHAQFFVRIAKNGMKLHYRNPEINLKHLRKMTTHFGILQFCKVNQPDYDSGYTLDDNARALIAFCQHYKLTQDPADLKYIQIYLNFIAYCECKAGTFMNYVDYNSNFTKQNKQVNLQDSTGRALWALGYTISLSQILPDSIIEKAQDIFERVLPYLEPFTSPRAMAFIIKGIYYYNRAIEDKDSVTLAQLFSDRLVQMYRHEASEEWKWFESYLTYANSVLPEALLCAYALSGNTLYKTMAKESFDFLLSKTFTENSIKVISNKSWHHKGLPVENFGEQPIDVAYTIISLRKFHDIFKEPEYLSKMESAFNWFLGNNHLKQIVYNPCTGGCYDGLEEHNVNLNQGAESTVSYLMARLMSYKFFNDEKNAYQRRRTKLIRKTQ